ncbi:hypothetical protein [Ureibacillus chungkukjangi]|uniref:Uncharacterized protein n=1 Tax=Ureibacillus chungkukjangi TaxID=1202712 RepID=A0A318TX80_9BACL|nr:hypothetical protein [Ureibacillus chungkukjangi]PYF08357.1 hypothetical protein BJ095_102122 [Ureibacillus chungkukjangi]
MEKGKPSRLEGGRAKYAGIVVALGLLYNVVQYWGENWFWTIFFSLGALICGTIGYFDLRRAILNNKFRTNNKN